MKTVINKNTVTTLIMVFAVAVGLPVNVGAVARTEEVPTKSAFCQSILKADLAIKNEINARLAKLTSAQAKADSARSENRTGVDSTLELKRVEWDKDRQANFVKLDEKATTTEQKAAVAIYKAKLLSAIKVRRDANDQARQTFRTAVDSLVASHRTNLNSQSASFRLAAQSALDTAASDCAKDQKTTADVFRASLKKARDDYKMQRTSDAKIGEQIKALAATRNASIKSNDAVMRLAVDSAREDLKLALKEI